MNPHEIQNWSRAAELFENILELPADQQQEQTQRIGKEFGLLDELQKLLNSTQRSSILDESLQTLLEEIPTDIVTRNALSGRSFGPWLLGEEIGRGGMSVVYLATRSGDGFTQEAALKILSVAFLSDEHVAGFLRERKILSELTHPGIARLIDGGVTPDGAPYLIMDLVKGQRIDSWCHEQQLNTIGIVRLVEQVCRAVSHAHRHLVVHRDINPSNVLMDQRGHPILVDFGIAKLLGVVESGQTLQAFTPEFAAPEQQHGESVTTATDVFGLGKLLSCLLKGRRLDRDLRSIINAATHEDPEQRYTTAKSMADDLQAWLENRPVRARPDTLLYRSRKYARRHWQWLSVAGLATFIALFGILSTLRQTEISRREAQKHQAVASFMQELFEQADVMRAGEQLRVTDLLETASRRAQQQIRDDPETLVALLTLIASGQLELSNYDAAEKALDQASQVIDANTISAGGRSAYLEQRGKQAYELGNFNQAVAFLKSAVGLIEDDNTSQKQYFLTGATLVSYLVDAESYEEARTLAEHLQDEVSQRGADIDTLVSLAHRYAIALEVTGDIEPAMDQYRHALQLQQQSQPGNSLGRAAILDDYGIALYFDGRYEESEAALRETIQLFSQQLNPPHPRLAASMHNLAFSLVGQGLLDEATIPLTEAYDMTLELHGPDHIDSLLEQATLATVMARSGDFEHAEPMFRENLAALSRIAPEMLVQRGSVHSYLGDLLLQTGRLEESRTEYMEAQRLFQDLPSDNVRVIEVRQRLAEIEEKLST